MSFSPKPFGKNNPCPVCEKADIDCRYNADDLDFIQCHTFVDSRKGERVNGFICVKESNGHTASFKPDNSTEWTEERRREWADEQRRRRERSEREEQQKLAQLLPIPDRDEQYRRIVATLGLNQKHRISELSERRGLKSEEIDFAVSQGWVASWKPGVKVDVSSSLSGVTGGQLTGVIGLAIAAVNPKGEITGFQIASDNRAKFGKYIWLSSAARDGNGPHLPSGELPVFVWRHPEAEQITETWNVEGGLKSLITALQLWFRHGRKDIQIIGAAGANWLCSINAVIDALGQTSKVVLCPDAGSLSNSGILSNYKKIIEALTSKAHSVSVAWWNQLEKGQDPDIDELDNILGFDLITPGEFFAIADQQLKLVLTPDTDTDKTEASKPSNPIEWKEAHELRRKDRASFQLKRNAQIVVKDGFLPSIKLDAIQPGIIGLRGDWGIGKSFLISSWCKKEWKDKIIQVAHLNALLSNTAPKFDCFHHRELKDMQLGVTSASRLSITDISLAVMFDPEKWAKGEPFILVLDEIEQVLNSIQTNSNLKGKLRLKARIKLEWLIKNATYIIASDRDLCDETLSYIEQVRGDGKKAFLIHHTGKKGISRRAIAFNSNKRKDEVLTRLINDAKLGNKIIIPCENKSDLLAIELQLLKAGIPAKFMFFAHGDNSNEPGTKELIEKADEIYTDYQIVGYTMTMGTALSFEKEHFEKCYAFFSGDVLSASSQAQMLFRYRPECDITVWINPRRKTLEFEPSILLYNLVKKIQETDALIASIDQLDELIEQGILLNAKGEISQEDLPWIHHKLSIIGRGNASKINPFQSLHDLLIEAGFTLKLECNDHEEPLMTDEGNIHKEQKKEIREAEDKAIAEAELMSDPEFQSAMMNSGNLKKSERERLKKTQLHRDTGLEITQPIVKLQRTKKLTQGVKTLKVLLGDEATSVAYDLTDRERNPDVNDQKFYAARRRLLCELGVPEILNKLGQEWSYTNDTSEVKAVGDKARTSKLRVDIKRLLGFTVSLEKNKRGSFRVSNSAILGLILNALSVERESKKTRTEGNIYKLNLQHWEMVQGILAHMDRQPHTPTLAGVIEKAQAAAIKETLETQSQSVIEGVPHPTNISYIYKNSEGMEQKPEDCVEGVLLELKPMGWTGLKLRLRQGLEVAGSIWSNWYQELSEKFGQAIGVSESEPIFNGYMQAWQVHVAFSNGLGSVPSDWLEAVEAIA